MDDQRRRAEELLEQRMKTRKPNGAAATADETVDGGSEVEPAEAADLTRDLQRLAADFANYRKRNDAERVEFAKFAKADLIAKLLDVLDGYDRALATVPDEAKKQPWVEGMWLVERKLRSILEAEGLEPIDSLGKPFDPYVHEAVSHVESEQPDGTVIEEFQKAYRLHDRVIRPALVAVAKAK
ncbi:MAG TPA: nucleotide exchange factor GrpE [Candidatus Limnocylindria bacterium]|nr:nucleotide exchange factor GrpE [Candidatus Limnocylindria bacterium]